jgi:hypothetical protein
MNADVPGPRPRAELAALRVEVEPRREPQTEALLISLDLAVPLQIMEVQGQSEAWRMGEARRCADVVATHGDDLQFGGKYCAPAFNSLARGLALGAMVPGGVTFMGRHWEVNTETES